MKTFIIPDKIADQYRGCGYALAKIANGTVTCLHYVEEPDHVPTPEDWRALKNYPGEAAFGMASCWEFSVIIKYD